MDVIAFIAGVKSRALALGADPNEVAQIGIYMEAFKVFVEREAKYHSLWKQYGAVDSYHHVTSKAARAQFYLEGHEDESDPLDLINYTAFLIRNMREGRIHNEVVEREGAVATAQEDIKAGDLISIDLHTGKARRLPVGEPDEEPVRVTIRNYQGEVPTEGCRWYCYSCDFHTSNTDKAAAHADRNCDWVWLYPDAVSSSSLAMFEMHYSDSGGVYLNKAQPLRWSDFYQQREKHMTELRLAGKVHVD